MFVLIIAFAVAAGWAEVADGALMHGAARLVAASDYIREAAGALTRLGDFTTRMIIAIVIAMALWLAARRRDAIFLLGATGGGALFNSLLKMMFGRARPDLLPQLDIVHSLSFPSGHSAGAAVLWLSIALVVRRSGGAAFSAFALAVMFMAAIGLSRVALAVHWPSDVLAGWCAGAAWFLLSAEGLSRADRRLMGKGGSAPTAG